jgi:hypothetical protein
MGDYNSFIRKYHDEHTGEMAIVEKEMEAKILKEQEEKKGKKKKCKKND